MFWRNNKKSPDIVESVLAIDIGTENIKVCVFIEEDDKLKVIGYAKLHQSPSAMNKAFITDLADVTDTLDRCIGEAISGIGDYDFEFSLPRKSIVGIAGELVRGASILVNVDREQTEKKIDLDEFEDILNKVVENTFSATKLEIAEDLGMNPDQISEVETVINSTFIDGKRVVDLIDRAGKELTFRVFSSFAPTVHLDAIRTLASELSISIERIILQPYALSQGVGEVISQDKSGIIIDIGGGTTDVAVVVNSELIGVNMFGIGGRTLTKRIQQAFQLEYEEAEQIKIDYTNGNLQESEKSKIADLMVEDVKIWMKGVELALKDFEDIESFPTNIYLCGGGSVLPEIHDQLMEYSWVQSLGFLKHPKIKILFPNSINSVEDLTKKAKDVIDVTPFALARSYLDRY